MNRTEFIIVTAIILLIAFALGWFSYWLLHRFARVSGGDMGEMDNLAQSLHEAEEMRDQALIYLEQREAELLSQISQTEANCVRRWKACAMRATRARKCAPILNGCTRIRKWLGGYAPRCAPQDVWEVRKRLGAAERHQRGVCIF